MTVLNAKRMRPARRPYLRAGAIGLAIGLVAAVGAVDAAQGAQVPAAQATQAAPKPSLDPSKQAPGQITVSNIDFKRGDGGAGRLALRFSGGGAMPDMRSEGSRVIIDVGNAKLPSTLQKPIDVVDFATPVQRIDARADGAGTKLVLATNGNFESMAYQTGNEYVVEIVPRAVAKGVGGTTAAGASTTIAAPVRAYSGRPVTFNFQDVPVRTVLQLIAEESNLNVVASDTVSGNVTLRLINVPWDQALDIVLRAKGLDKRRDGNVVWVAPQDEIAKYEQAKEDARIAIENRAEMVTEYIPINYGNAEEIAKLLTVNSKNSGGGGGAGGASSTKGFLSPRGSVSFDNRTNTLLVIDIPKKIQEIKELLATLDRPVDQVLIEARIVVASESFARDLGAEFGVSNTDTSPSGDTVHTGGFDVNFPVSDIAAGALNLSILRPSSNLDLRLTALESEGRGEVISNPRVITSNQREAIIRQGDEIGYITVQPAQAGAIPQATVQFKEVLLELKVTPTITQDGRVYLTLGVKKDEVKEFVSTPSGDVPQIQKREVSTAVLVDNGQTVVIGGVYEFKNRSDISKIPFLGDVPVLGGLFKKKGKSIEKAELLIFVTPRVLQVAKR